MERNITLVTILIIFNFYKIRIIQTTKNNLSYFIRRGNETASPTFGHTV